TTGQFLGCGGGGEDREGLAPAGRSFRERADAHGAADERIAGAQGRAAATGAAEKALQPGPIMAE
ncbi:MAG: hypothetical protein RBT36_10810, partial [Desulfobulbus sp.]|nr:hypothetical protein [Desulfobulbus sp.]